MVNSSAEVQALTEGLALKKYKTPFAKLLLLAVLAGAYIALGGLLATYVAYGSPAMTEAVPSVTKFLAGAFFPIGLVLIVLVGGELFTGNTFYLAVGARQGVVPWWYVPYNWVVVYLGNLVGALLFSYLFVHLTGLLSSEYLQGVIQSIGEGKVEQEWLTIFLKGIAANWLVCLALMLGLTSQSVGGKLLGIWWPIMVFVTLGYEHSIANMFYIPMAMMSGANIGVWQAIWHNFIPSTLGNIVGGALFVGVAYSWLYGEKR